jgi:D-beta-D-heptose 7-phosphate kinase/D-beta-D-heptose 1-phosphate adenosyltransferase
MMRKIVLVTGGFDPIHSGHISYFKEAAKLGDWLVVGLNSDEWLTRKKGKPFMPFNEREAVISELRCVDEVIMFDDSDNSAKEAIQKLLWYYDDSMIIFANGGDRGRDNIPEMDLQSDRVAFVFGVGGNDKKNSSSWILKEWKDNV